MISEQASQEALKKSGDELEAVIRVTAQNAGEATEKMAEAINKFADAYIGDCEPCRHAFEHGWWGKGTLPDDTYTHCSDCHVSMPSTQVWGHCTGCHNTFSGVSTFDAHQDSKECPPHAVESYENRGRTYVRKHHAKGDFHYYGSEVTDE